MRLVNLGPVQRGFTLIEVMVAVSIIAILAIAGLPALGTYISNSRIREAANVVVTSAARARSEAIKRNTTVTLNAAAGSLTASYLVGTTQTTLFTVPMAAPARVANFSAPFDSTGRLTPFGTDVQAAVDASNIVCGGDILCPKVHIEAGGMVSLCTSGACS